MYGLEGEGSVRGKDSFDTWEACGRTGDEVMVLGEGRWVYGGVGIVVRERWWGRLVGTCSTLIMYEQLDTVAEICRKLLAPQVVRMNCTLK